MNQLLNGDCLEQLRELAAKGRSVDLIFADPPYNIGYTYDVYDDKRTDQEYLDWSKNWIEACRDVLSPQGAMWIAIGDEYAAELKLIASQAGLTMRNWVIWYYTFGVHCTSKFTRSHTHLLYFVKDAEQFTFNDLAIRVPSARTLVYADSRADVNGRVPDNTWILRPHDVLGIVDENSPREPGEVPTGNGFAEDHDSWYIPRIAGTFKQRAGFHGCQMPERLLERIIKTCSNPGDTVLDPFAGSGSTLIVAKKLRRDWVGIEMSADYAAQALARLEACRTGDPIEGPENPLMSAPPTHVPKVLISKSHFAALKDAYHEAADCRPVSDVLADPVLNATFIDLCGRQGLPGRPRDWNRAILDLEKQGDLESQPLDLESVRTEEPYMFASEIALRHMLDQGFPLLDEILCDPMAVMEFDRWARLFAPGFSSYDYRRGAINLRALARDNQTLFPVNPLDNPGLPSVVAEIWESRGQTAVPAHFKSKSGVCLLRRVLEVRKKRGKPGPKPTREEPTSNTDAQWSPVLYVAATNDAYDFLQRIVAAKSTFQLMIPGQFDWRCELYPLSDLDQRREWQSRLMSSLSPDMNYAPFGREEKRSETVIPPPKLKKVKAKTKRPDPVLFD